MARALTVDLDASMLFEKREPDYRVEIYDIRSTTQEVDPTRINDVVLANLPASTVVLPTIVGPRDFTDDVQRIDLVEVAGDYAQNGVAATRVALTISDKGDQLDPVENPPTTIDPEADGRWLRQKNVVVIREGDRSIPVVQWPITFTGALQGQPGKLDSRANPLRTLTAKANSREVDFLRDISTSQNFGQNTPYATMAATIAEDDMGLDPDEIDFGGFSIRLTEFRSTQFVQESPLVSIAKIMFPDGFMPRFLGNGQLSFTSGIITKSPARSYPTSSLQIQVDRPIVDFNGTNDVVIVGLNPNMNQITQERQEVASASITTGFFSGDSVIPVRWSEDKTQQAEGVDFQVIASIGASLFSFGSESFTNFPLADGGSVEGEILVDGAIGAGIALVALAAGAWIGAGAIPDIAPPVGGPVAPVGKVIQSAIGSIIFGLLGSQARGEYRVNAQPYEFVFEEIRCTARVSGLLPADRQTMEIENHLINSVSDCDTIAERILRRERAKQNSRTIRSVFDLRIEPDDVIALQAGVDQRSYMIQQVSRTLTRGNAAQGGTATLTAFELTPGVRP